MTHPGVDASGEDTKSKQGAKSYDAIQVDVFWGDSLLNARQWAPPKSVYASDDARHADHVDILLPSDSTSVGRFPIVRVRSGQISVVIPPNVHGELWSSSVGRSLSELVDAGEAQPFAGIPGALEVPFPEGARARLVLSSPCGDAGDLVVLLSRSTTSQKTRTPWRTLLSRTGALPYVFLSLITHVSVLATADFFYPPAWLSDEGEMTYDQLYAMHRYLLASQEREEAAFLKPRPRPPAHEFPRSDSYIPANDWMTWSLPRWQLYPACGLLRSNGKDMLVERYVANWDPPELAGGLYALTDAHLEAFKNHREGYAVIDAFPGRDRADQFAYGFGAGPHFSQRASVRLTLSRYVGTVPRDAILHRAYQSLGRIRLCYDLGLRENPRLQGRARLAFTIDAQGNVSRIRNAGSDLPDAGVFSCVMHSIRLQSFPEPPSGTLDVALDVTLFPPPDGRDGAFSGQGRGAP